MSSTEEFLELSPERLKELVALVKLNVGNEKYIFEAVVKDDVEARRVFIKDVMSEMWVHGLDSTYLQDQMMADPLVRDVIRECYNILLSPTQQGEIQLTTFKPCGYSECIITLGGEESPFHCFSARLLGT
ncbi:UNVERIFIED_CONTAM: hypothetical protein FKN15_054781 [Acipenser sinensis]